MPCHCSARQLELQHCARRCALSPAERHVPNCGTLWRGSGECWRLSNINQIVKLPREVSFAPLSQLIFTPTPSVLYACWCRWKCLSAATNVNEAKATSRRPEDGLKKGACVSDLLSSRLVMSGVVTCAERVLAPQLSWRVHCHEQVMSQLHSPDR